MIHEPTEGRLGIVPTERNKKPALRVGSTIPETSINATWSRDVFTAKLFLIASFAILTLVASTQIFEGKTWAGFAFLNKTYETEINFIFWSNWFN